MRGNNVLGIIFPNVYDNVLSELTALRSMGSVPFGGRYRLIDFPLSSMVSCGISKVGIITKSNYQSLMDHVGSGRAWDLSRKNGGIYIIPPFNTAGAGLHSSRMEALAGAMDFLRHCDEEYVLLTDCNTVCSIDLEKMFDAHFKNSADITVAYCRGASPNLSKWMGLKLDESGRVTEAEIIPQSDDVCSSMNIYFMRKSLLERIVNDAVRLGRHDYERSLVIDNVSALRIFGYEETGFVRIIDGLNSYFDINMSLLQKENRDKLFRGGTTVYTKVRDEVPAIYGLGSSVKNSLVTDGCVIEGKVENCILSHGVHIGKGASVKNCILMNNAYISDGVELDCIIADKQVVIKPNKNLAGDPTYPIYIGKGIVI